MSDLLNLKPQEKMIPSYENWCSYSISKENLINQPIYLCNTCYGDSGQCCCANCAETCHSGHDVQFMTFGRAYCDCGSMGCILATKGTDKASEILTFSKRSSLSFDDYGRIELPSECKITIKDFDEACFDLPLDVLAKECIYLASQSKETFWLGASQTESPPRNALEALAARIFQHHTKDFKFDPNISGMEWWVQVKNFASQDESAIDLHYDKDENIADSFGIGVFPQISTVTYLNSSSRFQPTIIFPSTANDPVESGIPECYLSFPRAGKHISFDGRFLHGAPFDPVLTQVGTAGSSAGDRGEDSTRITFLVNIWMHHRPLDVLNLDDRIISDLTTFERDLSFDPFTILNSPVAPRGTLSSVEISRKDVKENSKSGEWITLPFISDTSSWGRDENETGLIMHAFIPSVDKLVKLIKGGLIPDTFKVRYSHEICAARLEYESLDEMEFCEVIDQIGI